MTMPNDTPAPTAPSGARNKTRRVFVYRDYLDGIYGVLVSEASEYHREVRVVDVALLDEIAATEAKLYELQERLFDAPVVRNRKFRRDYD